MYRYIVLFVLVSLFIGVGCGTSMPTEKGETEKRVPGMNLSNSCYQIAIQEGDKSPPTPEWFVVDFTDDAEKTTTVKTGWVCLSPKNYKVNFRVVGDPPSSVTIFKILAPEGTAWEAGQAKIITSKGFQVTVFPTGDIQPKGVYMKLPQSKLR